MAAGDYVIRRNNANTDTIPNPGSDLLLIWDTAVANVGSGITHSAGIFTLGEVGHFLVMYSDQAGSTGTTNNTRNSWKTTLTLAGAELIEGFCSSYIRKQSGSQEEIAFGCAIIEVTTTTGNGDELEIRSERDDGSTADNPDRIADRSGVTIVKLDDANAFARYRSSSPTAPSGTDNARVVMNIATQVEQDSVFSRSGNIVTINTTQKVLCLYSTGFEDRTNGNRSEYQPNIELAGTPVPGLWGNVYVRGTNQNCDLGGCSAMGMLNHTTGQAIDLGVVTRENGQGNDDPNVALQLWELPSGAETIILRSTAGNFNVLATNFNWPNVETQIDEAAFTFSDPATNIDVDNADDYIVMVGLAEADDAGEAGGNRQVPALGFRVNTTDQSHVGGSSFHRSTQTADHSAPRAATLLAGLSANDSIHVRIDRIGTESFSITNSSGSVQAIRLSSLFPSGGLAIPICMDHYSKMRRA